VKTLAYEVSSIRHKGLTTGGGRETTKEGARVSMRVAMGRTRLTARRKGKKRRDKEGGLLYSKTLYRSVRFKQPKIGGRG